MSGPSFSSRDGDFGLFLCYFIFLSSSSQICVYFCFVVEIGGESNCYVCAFWSTNS